MHGKHCQYFLEKENIFQKRLFQWNYMGDIFAHIFYQYINLNIFVLLRNMIFCFEYLYKKYHHWKISICKNYKFINVKNKFDSGIEIV